MADIQHITQAIDEQLSEMARAVIRSHLDTEMPANGAFLSAPDDREHHQTQWHQWGILTHSRVFLQDLKDKVPAMLNEWALWEPVDETLRVAIDGLSKWDLLQVVALLHDIGKFGARTRGRKRFHFSDHEKLSRRLITSELELSQFGLTSKQVEYIALAAGDHFVLGLARRGARERGKYSETFTDSADFVELVDSIRQSHPGDFVEIGVLFLADSLSKLHPPEGPETAMGQYDLNINVARKYLERVMGVVGGSV